MKNAKTILLVALVGVALTLASIPAGAGDLCARFEIASVENPNDFNTTSFQTTETTDLEVFVAFPQPVSEEHVITLKFFTPAGHLYRQIDVPIAPEGSVRGQTSSRRLPGYPYPVEVKIPENRRLAGTFDPAIEVRFPVGGTSIETSSLFGWWRVDGLVDGEDVRCFRPRSFEITQ